AREVVNPSCPLADLLDDVFEALALAFRDQPQQGPSPRPQGCMDRGKGQALFRHPVEGVKGNDEIEFIPVGQPPNVGHLKAEVRLCRGAEVARRKGNHVPWRVTAEPRAAGATRGDFRGNLPVPAADVEDALGAFRSQTAELLLGHRLLKARLAVIVARMPLRHGIPSVPAAGPSASTWTRMSS